MERGRGAKRGRGKITSVRIRWKSHFHAKPKTVQKLNLDDDWLTYSLPGLVTNHRWGSISVLGLSMEVRFPTDSTRGDFSSPLLCSLPSLHCSSLLINHLWNQGKRTQKTKLNLKEIDSKRTQPYKKLCGYEFRFLCQDYKFITLVYLQYLIEVDELHIPLPYAQHIHPKIC